MTNADGDKSKLEKKKSKEDKQPTKVVVRCLPPTMTLESFLEQVDPRPEYDYICHVTPDKTLVPHCFSRVYINFLDVEDMLIFTQKFDGYVFLDSKGHEYTAVVEFAPFQRVPKQKSSSKKKDLKCNTIDSDPYYIEFKEKLQEEREKAGSRSFKQHYFETTTENEGKKIITDTPLLQYLRNKNAEKAKAREDKREERKRKDAEKKKLREEQSQRRANSKKMDQEAYNMGYSGYGGKKDSFSRRKADERRHKDKDLLQNRSADTKSKPLNRQTSHEKSHKSSQLDTKDERKNKKDEPHMEFKDPAIIEMRIGTPSKSITTNSNITNNTTTTSSGNKYRDKYSNRNDRRNRARDVEDRKTDHSRKDDDRKSNVDHHRKDEDRKSNVDHHRKDVDHSRRDDHNNKNSYRNREFKNKDRDKERYNKKLNKEKQDNGGNRYKQNDKINTDVKVTKELSDNKLVGKRIDTQISTSTECTKVIDKSSPKNKSSNENKSVNSDDSKASTNIEKDKCDTKNDGKKGEEMKKNELVRKSPPNHLEVSPSSALLKRRKSLEDKQQEKYVESGRRNSLDSGDKNEDSDERDPRTERRIRNKDRPSMEIYRPGMGKFSKQKLSRDKVFGSSTESHSHSPSPTNGKAAELTK